MKNAANRRGTNLASLKKSASQLCFGFAVFSAVALGAMTQSALANPAGGNVLGGSGNATITYGTTTTINQTAQKVLINWNSFNIATGETTQFVQPNSNSLAVNRVTSGGASTIDGILNANGKVIIINPNGLAITKNARIDTAGFTATTADMNNSELNKAKMAFDKASSNKNAKITIDNGAVITVADAGLVTLVAPHIRNDGVIQGNLAKVQLAAADTFTVDLYGDGLLSFAVAGHGKRSFSVENNGWISADGGQILLTAVDASNLIDSVINNTGTLRAHSLVNHKGEIILAAADADITVSDTGVLDASGCECGADGGTVSVGDSYKLKGKTIGKAATTTVEASSVIKVDGKGTGNGGTITVTSTDKTIAQGTLSARSGDTGGNGGKIVTSSDSIVNVDGAYVDATADNGKIGEWVIAAEDMVVTGTSGLSGGGKSYIDVNAIETADANVTLRSQKDINIKADISIINPSVSLGFVAGEAGNKISDKINGTTYSLAAASGNITLDGHYIRTVSGNVQMLAGNVISLKNATVYLKGIYGGTGGNFSLKGGDIVITNTGIFTRGGDVDITAVAALGNCWFDETYGTITINGSKIDTTVLNAGARTTSGGIYYEGVGPINQWVFENSYSNTFVDNLEGGSIDFNANWIGGSKNCFAAGGAGCTVADPLKAITLNISADNVTKIYGDADDLTYTIGSSGSLAYGDTLEGNLSRDAGENVGTYTVYQGTLGVDGIGNYVVNFTNGSLKINPATLYVLAQNANKTYGDADPTFLYSLTGYKNGDTLVTVDGGLSRVSGENVGNYAITLGSLSSLNSNYVLALSSVSEVPAALSITPATLTLTALNSGKIVGQTDPALLYTASGFKLADTEGSVLSGTLLRDAGEVVSTYAINQGSVASNSNYVITFNPGTFTISAAPVPNSVTSLRMNTLGRPVISYENNVIANNLPFKGYEVLTMDTNVSMKVASNEANSGAAFNAIAPASGGDVTPEQLNAMAPASGGNRAADEGVSCGNNFLDNKPCSITQ